MKIKIFKNKKSFKKGGFHTNPDIGWEFILYIALIIILAAFIFGFYLFNQVSQEPILPATNGSGQVPIVNKSRLEKVLNYFSQREQKSNQILNSPAPVVDPSL